LPHADISQEITLVFFDFCDILQLEVSVFWQWVEEHL